MRRMVIFFNYCSSSGCAFISFILKSLGVALCYYISPLQGFFKIQLIELWQARFCKLKTETANCELSLNLLFHSPHGRFCFFVQFASGFRTSGWGITRKFALVNHIRKIIDYRLFHILLC